MPFFNSAGKTFNGCAKISAKRQNSNHLLTGDLQANVFEGTLNEIIPVLTDQTLKTKKPSILINAAGDLYSLVFVEEGNKSKCKKNEVNLASVRTVQRTNANESDQILKIIDFCK